MTPATKDVVSSFVNAWDYMTGQYPGHRHARTPGLAVSLSQTNCSFFNMLIVDRPIDSPAELHGVFAEARRQDAQCPHDSMVVVCPEWLPEGAEAVLADHKMVHFMNMRGMSADNLLPPRRRPPGLDFRRAADEAAGLDVGIVNAAAYGMPSEFMAVTGAIPNWSGQAYGIVGYDGATAVTSTLSFVSDDMIYIAMVATLPGLHGRGYAEAAMRRAIAEAQAASGASGSTPPRPAARFIGRWALTTARNLRSTRSAAELTAPLAPSSPAFPPHSPPFPPAHRKIG